ncbi:leucyl aminopeptidase family protein [uncultured bacterium]|nr:leucyl aminopeptidase family protein [uncultured bacterium]
MKCILDLSFGDKSCDELLFVNDRQSHIKLTLQACVFDNIQITKRFIKKYILSNILKIKSLEISVYNCNDSLKTKSVYAFDAVFNTMKELNNSMENITIKFTNFNIKQDNHILFKKVLIKYMKNILTGSSEVNPENLCSIMNNDLKEFITNNKFLTREIIAHPDNFPLIHAVGKGGEKMPRLFVCAFGVEKEDDFYNTDYLVCNVGKGVTFDTGGYSLKPTQYMKDMYIDKGGSILAFYSSLLCYLIYSKPIIFITPIVQNYVSANAYVPGDILVSKLGVKVHVDNTDAEGRLILADAMEFAVSNFKFKYMFNYATLTGAAKIALGPDRTAVICTNKSLGRTIEDLSVKCGEKIHMLPFDKYYTQLIKHNVRHVEVINNISVVPMAAGTITGGAFIEYFYNNAHKVLKKNNIPTFCHYDVASLIEIDYNNSMSFSYNLDFNRSLFELLLENHEE